MMLAAAGTAVAAMHQAQPAPKKNAILGGSAYTGKPKGKPVKVLVVGDKAGKLGKFGPASIQGAELMAAVANESGGIMGRPVELIVRDDQADVAVATRETQAALRSDKPDVILGENLSSALLAQGKLASEFGVPIISGTGGDIQFVTKGPAGEAHLMQGMVAPTSQIDACGFARYAAQKHPEWKRYAIFVTAFVFGRDLAASFETCIKKYNPQATVVVKREADFGTQSYLPFVNAILSEKPDFIFSAILGPDLIRLLDQYEGAGGTVPIASFVTLDEARAIGANMPSKFRVYAYTRALATALPKASQPFRTAFRKKFGDLPSDNAVLQAGAFLAYKAAVEKARSFEPKKVMEAFRCLTYFEPRGWVKIRAINGQGDVPEFFGRLVSTGGAIARLDPKDSSAITASQVWQSDAELRGLVPASAQRSAAKCK
jgi:branched-chain amino acid transport system substrate-binding protein